MTIRYANGQILKAVLLSQGERTMRVAIEGRDDSFELKQIHGVWVTEECEPVEVEFSWSSDGATLAVTEADCICRHELATRLIHMLYAGEEGPAKAAAMGGRAMAMAAARQVV